ncbi:MAG TPA: SDR family oxidoreductase [Acidimicrobiales bacterium]|nr:SDR family oxidoreductase [Acidimicrobiales bacterium]
MDVAIAGGHGKIALRLERLLAAGGHRARALIRNPDHASDVAAAGAEPVVLDLEAADAATVTDAVRSADAVVFAAGAGPGSGPARKRTVDYGAAVALIEAARAAGVDRYVMVSSIGAHDPASGRGDMGPYLKAKADADAALLASGLRRTIVRPGGLTDEPGTGLVTVSTELGGRASVPRDDVAAVLLATLVDEAAVGVTFELFAGDTPIAEALAALDGT